MYVCTPCELLIPADQDRTWDPLELESQMVVSHRVVLGIKPRSSMRAASALSSSPQPVSGVFVTFHRALLQQPLDSHPSPYFKYTQCLLCTLAPMDISYKQNK